MAVKPPVVLSIAGSDASGGAGIQADLKVFSAMKTYGTTAITCTVAEHPGRVQSIQPLPARHIADQIRLIFEAFPVSAVKTGMLYSAGIIRAVANELKQYPKIKLVIDPVMIATSGAALLKPGAVRALKEHLLPLASIITPNINEAELLLKTKIHNLEEAGQASIQGYQTWRTPCLIKGGHLKTKQAVDVLFDGKQTRLFRSARIAKIQTHGTGCAYSAAICARLAHGDSLTEAVANAKRFITRAIREHHHIGRFTPLNYMD